MALWLFSMHPIPPSGSPIANKLAVHWQCIGGITREGRDGAAHKKGNAKAVQPQCNRSATA
jgi:hypothetical protein